jgi:hypothetical protein
MFYLPLVASRENHERRPRLKTVDRPETGLAPRVLSIGVPPPIAGQTGASC